MKTRTGTKNDDDAEQDIIRTEKSSSSESSDDDDEEEELEVEANLEKEVIDTCDQEHEPEKEDEKDDANQEDEKAKCGLEQDATVIGKWIERECKNASSGTEEDWDKAKAYVLADRSIWKFKSYVTILGTEERACSIFGMTKVHMNLQMGKAPQVLAHL